MTRWLVVALWLLLGGVGIINLSLGWQRLALLTAVSLGYAGINLWFDKQQNKIITLSVVEEYLAVSILGIALLGFLLYY